MTLARYRTTLRAIRDHIGRAARASVLVVPLPEATDEGAPPLLDASVELRLVAYVRSGESERAIPVAHVVTLTVEEDA